MLMIVLIFTISTDIDECVSSPCQHIQATCVDQINSYICQCPTQYTGVHCEQGKKHGKLLGSVIKRDVRCCNITVTNRCFA